MTQPPAASVALSPAVNRNKMAGVSTKQSPAAPLIGPPAPLWDFAAATDVGMVRENNEDALAVEPLSGLVLLADGMGGYRGGEVASAMAVALLQATFGSWLAHAGPNVRARAMFRALQSGVDDANSAILEAGQSNTQLLGMGTTLVVAVFGAARAVVGHIGDSRCYRLRDAKLEQMTRDHSLIREQLDSGQITQEEADRSPHGNLVTRALGIEPDVQIEMHEHPVLAGDLYLLCSDGLNDLVCDAQLFTLLLQDCDLSEKAAHLIAAANQNGGRDNISVVLAQRHKAQDSG